MTEIKCVICQETKSSDNFSEKALNNINHKDVHLICFDCMNDISKIEHKTYKSKVPTGIVCTCRECKKEKDRSLMLSETLCNDCYLESCRKRTN